MLSLFAPDVRFYKSGPQDQRRARPETYMADPPPYPGTPRWVKVSGIAVGIVTVLMVVLIHTPAAAIIYTPRAVSTATPQPRAATDDHGTGLRKFALIAHIISSVGLLGSIAGLPGSRRCRIDPPDADRARRLSGDGFACPVRHPSIGIGFAAHRAYSVGRYPVGLVPALLGAGKTLANRYRHHRLVGQDGAD